MSSPSHGLDIAAANDRIADAIHSYELAHARVIEDLTASIEDGLSVLAQAVTALAAAVERSRE